MPHDEVAAVYDRAAAKHGAELKQLEQIARGENSRAWLGAPLTLGLAGVALLLYCAANRYWRAAP